MSQLYYESLRQLLMQAGYAPEKQKKNQISACEALISLVRPGKEYPFEFVCFHLTGYRPKRKNLPQELLQTDKLLSDLSLFASELSKTIKQSAADFKGDIFTKNALAKHFNVCEKTINRWRRSGLVGRYLLLPDGRLHLCFRKEVADYFAGQNKDKIRKGNAFNRLNEGEKQAILNRLSKWSGRRPACRQEALKRTARKFGRSFETIRSLLLQQETEKAYRKSPHALQPKLLPESKLRFFKRQNAIDDQQRGKIYELFQNGVSVTELMRQYNRSKTNIYRAINWEMAHKLLEVKIQYIPNKHFSPADSQGLDSTIDKNDLISTTAINNREAIEMPARPEPLENYINEIKSNNLLTAQQEKMLFQKYNYLKFQAHQLQQLIDINQLKGRLLRQIRSHLEQAEQIKKILIQSNLRLVTSISRKHARNNDTLMQDYISEGNLALINAVDKFDFSRGFKFSTYATWAIVKRFATFQTQQSRHPAYEASEEMLEVAQDYRLQPSKVTAVEDARKSLEEIINDTLEEREKSIIRQHYGLLKQTELTGQRKPKSLSQIGRLIGLSKERVRQIELVALQKLRRALTGEQFDLLTQS